MLLIDGYNLLHVTRFQPQGRDQLRESREALLTFLADSLDPERYPEVTLVFDASAAPRRLPPELTWRHLHVYFARDHASADEMIECMIRQHPSPRQLTVVSSDHRIQRAAKRRKATFVDSDQWFDALLETPPPKPTEVRIEPLAGTEKERARADLADEDWPAFFAAALTQYEASCLGELDPPDESERHETPEPNDNPFPRDYIEQLREEFSDDDEELG